MSRLRVSVSPTLQQSDFIHCPVNEDLNPVPIRNAHFEGLATVRVRNFDGAQTEYFGRRQRKFSIQVEGRFKQAWSGDQIVMAADFDHPLSPPFGLSLMVEFAKLIDPGLEMDIYASKPYVQSPILCAMNVMANWPLLSSYSSDGKGGIGPWKWGGAVELQESMQVDRSQGSSKAQSPIHPSSMEKLPPRMKSLPSAHSPSNSNSPVHPKASIEKTVNSPVHPKGSIEKTPSNPHSPSQPSSPRMNLNFLTSKMQTVKLSPSPRTFQSPAHRRKYFLHPDNRKKFVFDTETVYAFDWFSPFINWNSFELQMGLKIKAARYLNGQPVRFFLRTSDKSTIFMVIEFKLVD